MEQLGDISEHFSKSIISFNKIFDRILKNSNKYQLEKVELSNYFISLNLKYSLIN